MLAGPRETGFIGAVAVILAAASVGWNDNFGDAYLLRLALVIAGSAIAVVAARSRVRTLVDRRRFALLADVADVADGRLTLEETAEELCALMVPEHADACVIDALDGDELRRLAAVATGTHSSEREQSLMAAPAWEPPPGGRARRARRRDARASRRSPAPATPCDRCPGSARCGCRCAHAAAASER